MTDGFEKCSYKRQWTLCLFIFLEIECIWPTPLFWPSASTQNPPPHTHVYTGIPGMLRPCRPEGKSSVYVIEAVLVLWAVIWWADNSTTRWKLWNVFISSACCQHYKSLFPFSTPAVCWKLFCLDFDVDIIMVFHCSLFFFFLHHVWGTAILSIVLLIVALLLHLSLVSSPNKMQWRHLMVSFW